MNSAIEFHDSEVSSVEAEGELLSICFSAAYVHKSNGIPGVDPGAGYIQSVVIQLAGSHWNGQLNECVGKLSNGRCTVNGQEHGLLPVPSAVVGSIRLSLNFANGSELTATASGLEVLQKGDASHVESFGC